ncbi:MAG: hypothetical protein L3K02_03155 [Thermoplasmata archaeon]|nr:hypothetical protein [Thermoplasmata archaeon]
MPDASSDRDPGGSFSTAVQAQRNLLREGAPAVHVAVLDGTVVSVGVGVPDEVPYLGRARSRGLPVVRRSSGGTGILHLPRDLVWAVVLPRSHRLVGRTYVHGYSRLGAGVVTALATYGLASAWVPAPGLSEEYCPLGPRGYVLEVDGRIVGAAAQHLTGSTLLHHGTLSHRVDRALVRDVFAFPDPSVADRLMGLEERGLDEAPDRVAEAVRRGLARALEIE